MGFERDKFLVELGLTKGVTELIAETALSILSSVVIATPVGDPNLWKRPKAPPGYVGGRARANWTVSIGNQEDQEIEATDKSGSGTISKGKAVLSGFNVPWQKIYIQNNVPYMQKLNDGTHSKQARPAGFVERAIQAGLMNLDGKVLTFL